MHWAWRIAQEQYDARRVPPMTGVDIQWAHTRPDGRYDGTASRTAALAADSSPIAGVLAPGPAGAVFHATAGWHPANGPLRALDEAGRLLCCLRVNPRPLGEASDLRSGDAERGTRHDVTADGMLARRLSQGPLLAPVLQDGVKVVRTGSERSQLKEGNRPWTLDRCVTQEGLRLTISSPAQPDKAVFYFPLGYDVEPTCR